MARRLVSYLCHDSYRRERADQPSDFVDSFTMSISMYERRALCIAEIEALAVKVPDSQLLRSGQGEQKRDSGPFEY